jgi:phosphoribosyl-ATP pyrophosphohydrolase/phosphoribosyl-AMP cyclohydrolase
MQLSELKYDRDGLVTVVVQDARSGEIRMLAHADQPAIAATLETGFAHFYSRSRRKLWLKGETSGHKLEVRELWADCDGDALVYLAEPHGPSCHTERETCFFQRADGAGEFSVDPQHHAAPALARLWAELGERRQADAGTSYTKSLLEAGATKITAKISEEAGELAVAIRDEGDERVISEAGDLVYHVLVGLLARGLTWAAVEGELARRFGISGLVEKAGRTRSK